MDILIALIANLISILVNTPALSGLYKKFLNRNLQFYTPEEIEKASHCYVQPDCQLTDPGYFPERRHSASERVNLFDVIDQFLKNPQYYKYVLLLGDTGTGKTSFVLNFFARHLSLMRQQRYRVKVIPLGTKNVDKAIEKLHLKSKTVLFLDALDEDVKAGNEQYQQRVTELCEMAREFRNVLITCRTQFFPRAIEEPASSGISKPGVIHLGESGEYPFHKRYLSLFNDEQVLQYLTCKFLKQGKHFEENAFERARDLVNRISELTIRPMILAYIDDLIYEERNYSYTFQFYEKIVEAWLKREKLQKIGLKSSEMLRKFSELLAVELYTQRYRQGSERMPYEAVALLAKKFGIKLEAWKLTSRSLLNRDAGDNFKFAHRSIMEYLFVKQFIEGNKACRRLKWTPQMKEFLREILRDGYQNNLNYNLFKEADFPPYKFRCTPTSISEEESRKMLNDNEFFDNKKNKNGIGIIHAYELKMVEGDKIILDLTTNLTWQQGGSSQSLEEYGEAEEYINRLNHKEFAGFKDWRLPTLEEAMSLMEPEIKNNNLYIDPVFDKCQRWIWTADRNSDSAAWYVGFSSGGCYYYYGGGIITSYVRAVRSGQSLDHLVI